MKGKQIQFKINLDANEQQKRDLVSSILTEIMPEKPSWPLVDSYVYRVGLQAAVQARTPQKPS